MLLADKIGSLTKDNTVNELTALLGLKQQVTTTWWGQRMVSVEGYEGAVEINTVALRYLKAKPFGRDETPSLVERMACYKLWGRVQQLYQESEKDLKSTVLYQHLVPLKEFRPWCRACAGDPMAIIGEWDFGSRKEALFQFRPEEFKALWPNENHSGESFIAGGGKESIRWFASKELVEEAIQRESLVKKNPDAAEPEQE